MSSLSLAVTVLPLVDISSAGIADVNAPATSVSAFTTVSGAAFASVGCGCALASASFVSPLFMLSTTFKAEVRRVKNEGLAVNMQGF
jgi:hypothetical protein